jgi:hypothetical protein
MTPKEKAKELLDKYYIEHYCWSGNGYDVDKVTTKQCQKQCALIAVKFAKENPLNTDGYNKYLQEVNQEIELL